MVDDFEKVQIGSKKALWEWLSLNNNSDKFYLLVTWKKTKKERYVSREEVLDALLAYGWIDGRRYALDENQTMQLVCKRKQQKWTQSYRQRIEQLTANGLMKPSGLKSVEQLNQMATGSPMLMLMNWFVQMTSIGAFNPKMLWVGGIQLPAHIKEMFCDGWPLPRKKRQGKNRFLKLRMRVVQV